MRDDHARSFLKGWGKGVLLALMILLAVVWEHVQALRLGRAVKQLQQDVDRLTFENARLAAQINAFLTPGRLDTLARKELQMAPPAPGRVLELPR